MPGELELATDLGPLLVGGGATWATRYLRVDRVTGKRGDRSKLTLREIPEGARLLVAGRIDPGQPAAMQARGSEALYLFAGDPRDTSTESLRRRLRIHQAQPWIAAACLLALAMLLTVAR